MGGRVGSGLGHAERGGGVGQVPAAGGEPGQKMTAPDLVLRKPERLEGGAQLAVVAGMRHHERGGERVRDVDEDTALAGKDLEDAEGVRQAPDRGSRVRLFDTRRKPVADGAA
jgi:hypothetical protein